MVETDRPAKPLFDAFLKTTVQSYPLAKPQHPYEYVIFFSDVIYRDSYQYDPELLLLDRLEKLWDAACTELGIIRREATYKVPTVEDAVQLTRHLLRPELQQGQHGYALSFCIWPGDVLVGAGVPADFGQGCIIETKRKM